MIDEQCKRCDIFEHRKNMLSCNIVMLNAAFNELVRSIPFLEDSVEAFECPYFIEKDD